MATQPTTPAPRSNSLRLALTGCTLLGLCAALAGVLGGWWWLTRRGSAQPSQPTVEYIVDVSARMELESGSGSMDRLSVARSVLAEIVRPADRQVTAGLRVFGSGTAPDACRDTALVVPLAPASQSQIADELSAVQAGPSAEAALAQALVDAFHDLAATRGPYTLVVVTGGTDSCSPEAGQLLASEAEKAGIRLEFFVIGFQVSPEEGEVLKGMIAATPGATFLAVRDERELRAVLAAIQAHIDNPAATTVSAVLATARAAAAATAANTPPTANTPGSQDTRTPGAPTAAATEATDVVSEPQYEAETACDHPYLPLRPGATWTYAGSAGEAIIVTVSDVAGDLTSAAATLVRDVQGINDPSTAVCGPDGIRTDSTWGDLAGLSWQFGFGPNWQRSAVIGVWLPPASQLVPGATWTYSSSYKSNTGLVAQRDETFTVAGVESIQIDGQPVDALRVDRSFGYGDILDTSGSGSDWYVQGIGLVQWQAEVTTSGVLGRVEMKLQTYSLP